jgi:protein-disulfide isomerase
VHRAIAILAVAAACGKPARDRVDGGVAVAVADPAIEARLARLEQTVAKLTAAVDHQLGPVTADRDAVYAVAVDPTDPIDGAADAPVTIVIAFELLDPASTQLATALVAAAAKHAGDVRIAWKYLAVHGAPAIGPGEIACGASAQHRWPAVRDALLATLVVGNRVVTEKSAFAQLVPIAVAASPGLAAAQLERDRGGCTRWMDATKAALARFGVTTTPALFVNGRVAPTTPDVATLDAVITGALATAKQAMAADGITAADFYAREVIARGTTHVPGRFD